MRRRRLLAVVVTIIVIVLLGMAVGLAGRSLSEMSSWVAETHIPRYATP